MFAGTLCDYVGKPCVVDSECGRGLNCDSLGVNVSSVVSFFVFIFVIKGCVRVAVS